MKQQCTTYAANGNPILAKAQPPIVHLASEDSWFLYNNMLAWSCQTTKNSAYLG